MGTDVSSGPVFLSKNRGGLVADVSSWLIFLKKKKKRKIKNRIPNPPFYPIPISWLPLTAILIKSCLYSLLRLLLLPFLYKLTTIRLCCPPLPETAAFKVTSDFHIAEPSDPVLI